MPWHQSSNFEKFDFKNKCIIFLLKIVPPPGVIVFTKGEYFPNKFIIGLIRKLFPLNLKNIF